MSVHPGIEELSERCDSNPICLELWIDRQWQSWKHVLRSIGKRRCVAAALAAVGRLDGPRSYPNYTGTGNLPYDVHDRIQERLYAGLTNWLGCDDANSRLQIAEALAEFDNAVATERAQGWFIVCSDTPPVNVFATLAEAVTAPSSFEVHIRDALMRADSVAPGSAQAFRHELLGRRTTHDK